MSICYTKHTECNYTTFYLDKLYEFFGVSYSIFMKAYLTLPSDYLHQTARKLRHNKFTQMSKDKNLHIWNAMYFSARLEMAKRFHDTCQFRWTADQKQLPRQQLRKPAQGKGVVTEEQCLP